MFGWIWKQKKFGDQMETMAEARMQKQVEVDEQQSKSFEDELLAKYNFKMKDGVECLFNKVLDSVRYDFEKWNTNGYSWYTENIVITIMCVGSKMTYFRGTMTIDSTDFQINHVSCEKFMELRGEMRNKKNDMKQEEVLKKWGCK